MTSLPVLVLRNIRSGITATALFVPIQLVSHSVVEVDVVQLVASDIHAGFTFRSHFRPPGLRVDPGHAIGSKFYKERGLVIGGVQASTNFRRISRRFFSSSVSSYSP